MRNSSSTFPSFIAELLSCSEGNRPLPEGATLARILAQLAQYELQEGGPYALEVGRGVESADIGLNLAIALFLRSLGVRLPKLEAHIEMNKYETSSLLFDTSQLAAMRSRYDAPVTAVEEQTEGSADLAWTKEERSMLAKIREKLAARLRDFPQEFKETAEGIVERTIKGNPDKQMSLMPLLMRQAFGNAEAQAQLCDEDLADLGLANVLFWASFIIYDDFWDEDEAAAPRELPIANLFAREYVRFFSTQEKDLADHFHLLMDKLDAANEWELMHCRLERTGDSISVPDHLPAYADFGIKFYPAAGHVMGPLVLLYKLGYSVTSPEAEGLTDYFRHYLIAMQLNDDAHDWKEDLLRGHISTAIAVLLNDWKEAHPDLRTINVERDMSELEQLFWFKTLPQLCEAILLRTSKAQEALDELSFVENPGPLQQFIDWNREAAELALAEQRRSIAFLDAI